MEDGPPTAWSGLSPGMQIRGSRPRKDYYIIYIKTPRRRRKGRGGKGEGEGKGRERNGIKPSSPKLGRSSFTLFVPRRTEKSSAQNCLHPKEEEEEAQFLAAGILLQLEPRPPTSETFRPLPSPAISSRPGFNTSLQPAPAKAGEKASPRATAAGAALNSP